MSESEIKNLYKHRYCLEFYDEADETLLHLFDNVNEILSFQNKVSTSENKRRICLDIYRALKRQDHICTFLTGEVMRLYLADFKEDEMQNANMAE